MLIKRMDACEEIVANDGCRLRELLHPDRDEADVGYSVALAWVDPGERTLPHVLRNQTEVYLVLQGTGRMHIGDDSAGVAEGDLVVVPGPVHLSEGEPVRVAEAAPSPGRGAASSPGSADVAQ